MTNKPRPDFAKVVLSDDPQYMTVWFSWTTDAGPLELDRPIAQGISCLPRHVPRLIRAFLEGNLFDGPLRDRQAGPQIARDTRGQSYVDATCRIHGKTINRDLTNLGY